MNKIVFTVSLLFCNQALAAGDGAFYTTAEFYVAMSFLLVVICLAKPVAKSILSLLHGRINVILNSIEKAVLLRDDAKILLQKYLEKQKSLKKEIALLQQDAEMQTETLREVAIIKIEADTKAKMAELASKNKSMENDATAEIVTMISDKAIDEVKKYVLTKQDKLSQEKMVAKAIESL